MNVTPNANGEFALKVALIDRFRGFETLPEPLPNPNAVGGVLIATFTAAPFCTRSIVCPENPASKTTVQRPLTLRTGTDVEAWAVLPWLSVNVAVALKVPVVG